MFFFVLTLYWSSSCMIWLGCTFTADRHGISSCFRLKSHWAFVVPLNAEGHQWLCVRFLRFKFQLPSACLMAFNQNLQCSIPCLTFLVHDSSPWLAGLYSFPWENANIACSLSLHNFNKENIFSAALAAYVRLDKFGNFVVAGSIVTFRQAKK